MNNTMKLIEEIIVLLTATGIFNLIGALIVKSIFSKRTNKLDKTYGTMLTQQLEHLNLTGAHTKAQEATNLRLDSLEEKLNIVIEAIKEANTREAKRSQRIGDIINEEKKL